MTLDDLWDLATLAPGGQGLRIILDPRRGTLTVQTATCQAVITRELTADPDALRLAMARVLERGR